LSIDELLYPMHYFIRQFKLGYCAVRNMGCDYSKNFAHLLSGFRPRGFCKMVEGQCLAENLLNLIGAVSAIIHAIIEDLMVGFHLHRIQLNFIHVLYIYHLIAKVKIC